MIVITVTDTNTAVSTTAVVNLATAAAIFTGAEVGLDGADEETTGFPQEILDRAAEQTARFTAFIHA